MAEKIFSNLPSLICDSFKPAECPGDGWISFDYTLDDFSGKGLATGAYSKAGELVLELKLCGWHKIYVAFNPEIRIWLDGDKGYYQVKGSPHDVRDYFCFEADFTGKKLHIAPVRSAFSNKEIIIFYIRAVESSRSDSKRNLIATNDGHCLFWNGMDSYRDLYKYILPLENSDFFRIIWGVYGGGLINVKESRFADRLPWPDSACFYQNSWVFNRSLENLIKEGIDPLGLVRQITKEIGLELHFYFRVAAFYRPFPLHCCTLSFFAKNPQWHCIDEYGNRVRRISYAFKEVQDVICGYLNELLDYDPEGICLAFNRGLPLMICEKPVIEAFKKRYGRNPRLPEECDSPQMLSVRHNLLADFVERVYKLVFSRGKVLSCIVPRDFDRNLVFGLDIEMLASRSYFESILVGAGHKDDPEVNTDLEPVKKLKVAGTKIFPGGSGVNAHGGAWKPFDTVARASFMAKILDSGFDGAYFWDINQIVESGTEWEIIRQFGHREILDKIKEKKMPAVRYHQTKKIYDLTVDRYNPWNAY
ncbi:MAG: hypothetical protein NC831_05160 [Candidatus Omnitrophica bacterium]|nr:hypothetical protein [Candidatus Omnitrophota bacterium]